MFQPLLDIENQKTHEHLLFLIFLNTGNHQKPIGPRLPIASFLGDPPGGHRERADRGERPGRCLGCWKMLGVPQHDRVLEK